MTCWTSSVGFGPIQYLLNDEDVTEVMVNRADQVYIERKGKLIDTKVRFENDDHVLKVIERIVSPLGRRVDADSPMVDGAFTGWLTRQCSHPTGCHRWSAADHP